MKTWLYVVICIVIVGVVLFFFTRNTKETFDANNMVIGQEDRKAIVNIYKELLLRDPEEFEIQRAKALMNDPSDKDKVVEMIKKSSEYTYRIASIDKQKTQVQNKPSNPIEDKVANLTLEKRMDIYRSIVKVYESNLNRLPNMKELNYYTYRLVTDNSFSLDRLEKILQASQEYKILSKNQTNLVNSELPGNITDAQLTLEVQQTYMKIFGTKPDKEMEDFLKYKLVNYRLDTKRLEKLLKLIKETEDNVHLQSEETIKSQSKSKTDSTASKNDSPNSTASKNDSPNSKSKTDSTASKNDSPNSKSKTASKNASTTDSESAKNKADSQTVINIINPSIEDMEKLLKKIEANDECIDSCKLQKKQTYCISPYNARPYKDELYEGIRKEQNSSRFIDDDNTMRGRICDASKPSNPTLLRENMADYNHNRNVENLKYTCARNSYFLNIDDYIPSNVYEIESLGTSLEDAQNTKVGSIMPKFTYKEYTP